MSALTPGTRLGPYEVVSPLGAGGMGEVYRAKDTRLGRDVAVKVLPRHLSSDPEVRARFEREARTVSGLNHPNICTLFDVGREGEVDYLVMELVEGETLSQRLQKGALATPELLRFGAQIADALDRAHRAGVVHRDLKPGNVMITKSGAKLMDFGLARATGMTGPAGASGVTMAALTQSPTVATPLTAEGTIVGTFQYMSPEQLEGREADARSDLWSFGCVLYEMATGKRAFEGRSQASLITSIMGSQPVAVTQLAPAVPPALERLVGALLAKDPDERVQTAHDAKLQLQWAAEAAGLSSASVSAAAAVAGAHRSGRGAAWLPWSLAVLALVAAVAMFAFTWPRAHAPRPRYRFRVGMPAEGADMEWPRLSPDGRNLLFQITDSTNTDRAWVRPMDELVARPILGSERLRRAYWSPDGREIVFVADDKIQRLALAGGTPVVITSAVGGADLSWGSRGLILMDGHATDSLRSVPARGGELKPATRIDHAGHETGSAWPCFLPDGEHFLFIGITGGSGYGGSIRLGRIGSLESKLLGHSDGRVEYAPGGWVLYLQKTTLLARRLDLGAGRLTGEPITIAESVAMGLSSGHFSVSHDGSLALMRADADRSDMLQWWDRTGRPLGDPFSSGGPVNPSLSPDGHRLLLQRPQAGPGSSDEIWVRDLERGTESRLTFSTGAVAPVWSPDGRRFAFMTRNARDAQVVVIAPSDGAGAPDSVVLPAGRRWVLSQWAAAGSRLVFSGEDFHDLATISTETTNHALEPLLPVGGIVAQPAISPDGRWLAMTSAADAATPQIVVQSLVGPPGRWQISTRMGINAMWAHGGGELIYEQIGGALMTVTIDAHMRFAAGIPRPLISLPIPSQGPALRSWWPSEDGTRICVGVHSKKNSSPVSIDIVTDLETLLNRR
jgi:Tol biopolymer transport system component